MSHNSIDGIIQTRYILTMARPKREFIIFRPTIRDKAAIDTLCEKLGISAANVMRLAVNRMAELEGVQEQVAAKATLLESRVVSSVG